MRAFLPRFGQANIDITVDIFLDLAAKSRLHEVTDDIESADVILYTQAHAFPDWPNEMVKHIPARHLRDGHCFTYDERYMPWCGLPGLYVSMPKGSFDSRFQRAVPYAWLRDADFLSLRHQSPDQLFSFVGGRTHRVRVEVLALSSPRAQIEDSGAFVFHDPSADGYEERRRLFLAAVAESKFVLSPRGHGTSSIRLFETMAAARVPVIISDEWCPPEGPRWNDFCLFVAESDVLSIPERLAREEHRFPEMSAAAAIAYDRYFSESVRFDYMLERLQQLLPGVREFPRRGLHNEQHRRVVFRSAKRRARAFVTHLQTGGQPQLEGRR